MKKLLKGFTLAEVLITLGIIGVVAAVTLPSLQVNVNSQALSTQISKNYSQLQESIKLYMLDNHIDRLRLGNIDYTDVARNYLQVQYVCFNENDTACYADSYTAIGTGKSVLTRKSIMKHTNANSYILADGTTVTFIPSNTPIVELKEAYVYPNPFEYIAAYVNIGNKDFGNKDLGDHDLEVVEAQELIFNDFIILDLNGKKGPNKIGYDLFSMGINSDGTLGRSKDAIFSGKAEKDSGIPTDLKECMAGKNYGSGCFTYLVRNNFKIDY